MNIKHQPAYDPELVATLYSRKDGVPVKYVCSSALGGEEFARDIFYRETPHPEFGNRYFGLFHNGLHLMICDADKIEELEFAMIEHEGQYHYSRHRHDYVAIGDKVIDGGRAYIRGKGPFVTMKVKDGQFLQTD